MPNQADSQKNIEDTLLEAEVLSAKVKLQMQFSQNMAFFERTNPNLFNIYKSYTPTNQKIFYDTKGYINLLNIQSQKPAYAKDPKVFAKEQVDTFLPAPKRFTLGFSVMNSWNDRHVHLPSTNKVISEYKQFDINLQGYKEGETIGFLVMIGCGLGYQLIEMIERSDVHNIFLYDGNKDSFYASLYTIDWKYLVEEIDKKNGKIRICIGEGYFNALSQMRTLSREIGLFNLTSTFVFTHTNSTDNQKFLDAYRKDFHLNATGIGFFDDEQISFAHTIINIGSRFPIFNPELNKRKLSEPMPPVFIVGNGPSLDKLSDIVINNMENSIIVSCGSSISSLYKMGIKPDFHIEMERGLTTSQWIKMGTDREYTKDIVLLALNNVAPETASLFKETRIVAKPNDIGGSIILKEVGNKKYFELPLCNPTASNCAFSYIVHMGFKEIYLIGTDFGMRSQEDHHSKHSIYESIDKKRSEGEQYDNKTGKDYTYSKGQYKVKGNFCAEVFTINSLDMSRRNIEMLIHYSEGLHCYNPNDGAFIKGAKPTQKEDINISYRFTKGKSIFLKKLFNQYFYKHSIRKMDVEYVTKQYLSNLFKVKDGFTLPDLCEDSNTLYYHCNRIFKNLKALEMADKVTSMLIFGSIQMHIALLYSHCKNTKDDDEFKKCYQIGKNAYHELMNKIYDIIENDPLRPDDSVIKNIPQKHIENLN